MPFLQTADRADINYVHTPRRAGTPVVFLHALGLDLSIWQHQFGAFAGERELVALDLPGHGLSARPDWTPTFARMARTVIDALDKLQTGPVHLVGISVGAMIAQTLAINAPHLVSSLTLVATSCTFSDPVRTILQDRARTVREGGMAAITPLHLERWFPPAFRQERPDVLDQFSKILIGQDHEYHARMWDMVAGLDTAASLESIHCPVMVIAGEQDTSASPEAGRAIVNRIEGASLHVIAGSGHFPQMEYPLEFNALLRDFLVRADGFN